MNNVIVIGGGAAGLAAAISAAQAGAHVTVLEASKRVGQKILKTGNGRCNLTNTQVSAGDYYEALYAAPLIEEYPADRVLDFFDSLGLLTIEEEDGRIYPLSNSANTVLDVLRNACNRLGIDIACNCKVEKIQCTNNGIELLCSQGNSFSADRIIVATGGGNNLLRHLGHTVVPHQPVLCSLATDTKPLRGLSGVRVHAKVSAYENQNDTEPYAWLFGEVLFRDYGLSGIVIFDMSREVDEGDYIGLDFLPQVSHEDCLEWLVTTHNELKKQKSPDSCLEITYSELLCGVFHKRINEAILRMAQIKSSAAVDPKMLSVIVNIAKDFRVQVTGVGDTSKAQVTRGGAAIDEFDPLTLESKLYPNVFAAGETLSIDGRCGGFNLHWAWASGIAAGTAAAEK